MQNSCESKVWGSPLLVFSILNLGRNGNILALIKPYIVVFFVIEICINIEEMSTMIPQIISCQHCGSDIQVRTYRKFTVCKFCGSKEDFPGFSYIAYDKNSSMYSKTKAEMDCPACRSPHMLLGPSRRKWKCIDCGYQISSVERFLGVFWFCDGCEAYMNIQDGFTTKKKKWTCTECGYENSVTKKDIL